MTRILAAASMLALTACSPAQLAATGSRAVLSPETTARITGLCRQGEPLVRFAASMPLASAVPGVGAAKEIAEFVAGYCDALLVGAPPATTDGNTENWLAQNLVGLRGILGR